MELPCRLEHGGLGVCQLRVDEGGMEVCQLVLGGIASVSGTGTVTIVFGRAAAVTHSGSEHA